MPEQPDNTFDEADVRRYLDKLTGEEYDETDPIPDLSTFGGEKLYSQYIFMLLDELGESLTRLKEEHGEEDAVRMLEEASSGRLSPDTKERLQDNLGRLYKKDGALQSSGIRDADAWLSDPDTGMWERVLVLLGVSPLYADIMDRYFGSDGLVSIGVLLRSLLAGHLDISSAIYAVQKERNYGGTPESL